MSPIHPKELMAERVLSSLAVRRGRFGVLVALSLLAASATIGREPESGRILSHVKDLRQMSSLDATRGAPVRIKGSATALSGWKNSFFLHDASGGISVDRTDDVEVHGGDEVEVTNHVEVLGGKTLPPARPSFLADLAGRKQDGQRIELQGVVHSANESESWGRPVLFLVDATVRVRGVSGTAFDENRQFIGARLFVPSMDDVQVDQTAPEDSFAIPASTIQSLLQFGPAQGLSHWVRVSGILTGQRLDGSPFAPWNGLLVQLDGEIIDRTQHASEDVWIMRDGNKVFQAQIQTRPNSDAIAGVANGSRVRVTGICIIEMDEDQQPRSFRIELRCARDVAVLRQPRLTLAQVYRSPEVWCS